MSPIGRRSIHPSQRAFSHEVKVAILVFQNSETAVMFVLKTNPVEIELQ